MSSLNVNNKVIESYLKKHYKKIQEMMLFKNLIKEVEIGANGTKGYIIKQGINKGKKIKWKKNTKILKVV